MICTTSEVPHGVLNRAASDISHPPKVISRHQTTRSAGRKQYLVPLDDDKHIYFRRARVIKSSKVGFGDWGSGTCDSDLDNAVLDTYHEANVSKFFHVVVVTSCRE